MKAQKTHTLRVKVGEYVQDGETKNRYLYIGAVMKGEYGSFILLDKTFNPAGIVDDKPNVLISMFPVDYEKARLSPEPSDFLVLNQEDEVPF